MMKPPMPCSNAYLMSRAMQDVGMQRGKESKRYANANAAGTESMMVQSKG